MGWTRSSRRCGPHCPAPEHQPSLRGAQRRSNPASNQAHDGLLRGACHRARIRATRWLAMTRRKFDSNVKQRIHVHILAAGGARGLHVVVPQKREQGMPDARCTRGPVCKRQNENRTRAYRAAEAIRHSLRNGFTAYNALSPEYRAFLPPSPHGNRHSGPVGLSHLR